MRVDLVRCIVGRGSGHNVSIDSLISEWILTAFSLRCDQDVMTIVLHSDWYLTSIEQANVTCCMISHKKAHHALFCSLM